MTYFKGLLILVISILIILFGFSYWKKKGAVKKTISPLVVENYTISSPSKEKVKHTVQDDFPVVDRVHQLFTVSGKKLPIVETLVYASAVPWIKARPAWIADYAAYYSTSRHFIARSMHGKPDYFNQTISLGQKFNVLKKDKKIQFHLLVDVTLLKMALYYFDEGTNQRVLLKTYKVGLGRRDETKESGCLTPLGTYMLGDKISLYEPGVVGYFQDQKTEMIRIFGTRWIPFGMAVENCTEPPKGYGIHGAPWVVDPSSSILVENRNCLGRYESDGCIRLSKEDMEELFAIIITKPSYVHIVVDYKTASLPGVEVALPAM